MATSPAPSFPSPPASADDSKPATANMSTSSLPSPTIAVHPGEDDQPSIASHVSATSGPSVLQDSGYQSPLRHHRRTHSAHRQVKETLDARTEYTNNEEDGHFHHRINQYIIKEEIGRGSYGAVHLATDQFGNEYAVKEFSKARLRKRAQSNILRHGPRRPGPRLPFPGGARTTPLSPHFSHFGSESDEPADSLYLIREEVAIMKKLNHPNLVQLIEVLDDPEEDSLYMVLEMCQKGVVMKVGLDERAAPYPEETCRYWFRDLILGIEYLHAQGVIHRDIKPDNLLLSDQDELKIVDFGVSEMFERPDEMMTNKSAGSPAFLPPELCVAKHGDVSGKAADIWSMGVSLYCLRYGRIPFQREGIFEMFHAIKHDPLELPDDENPDFVDLLNRVMEKDPQKRIKMPELREHPWVTKQGTDRMLSAEQNCAVLVEPPNALELNRAFTRKMNHLLCVMKAIQKFKSALARRAAQRGATRSSTLDSSFNPAAEKAKAEEIEALVEQRRRHIKARESTDPWIKPGSESEPGSGHGPGPRANSSGSGGGGSSLTDTPFLGIGAGSRDPFSTDETTPEVLSDSPTAADFNIYDRAYEAEVERILNHPPRQPTLYLTRLVKERDQYRGRAGMVAGSGAPTPAAGTPRPEDQARTEAGAEAEGGPTETPPPTGTGRFAAVVHKAMAQ